MQNRLRLYCGPEDTLLTETEQIRERPKTVTIPAGEVFTWLADAMQNRRAWVRAFEDEELTISQDLYDVILAYQHFHQRPSA